MEEKEVKKVSTGETPKNSDKRQKLTYEQLNEACSQLFQQNQYLAKQLREANLVNNFKRLDYLFKVVELADTFKDADFVGSCIDEIKETIIIKEEPEETSSKSE